MTYTLPDDLAEELQALAAAANRDPAALLRDLLAQHRAQQQAIATLPQTPAEVRQRVYQRARTYWEAHDMPERAALGDAELDAVFDFIDEQGVPHLKADGVSRPHSPLFDLLGTLDTDVTDLSTTVRETLDAFYQRRYDRAD